MTVPTEILAEVGLVEPKKRGRPPKVAPTPEPLTRTQTIRFLRAIYGDRDYEELLRTISHEELVEKQRPVMEAAVRWEMQPVCKDCQGRPGYNPVTGIWMRSWDAANHRYIEGHRASCRTVTGRD